MAKERVAEETHYIRTPKGRRARVRACLPSFPSVADVYREIFDRGLESVERDLGLRPADDVAPRNARSGAAGLAPEGENEP